MGHGGSEIAYISFKKDMNIDDVVLIRRGNTVLVLVQVKEMCEDAGTDNEGRLDWFRYRRKIKVLTTDTKEFLPFPQPRMKLQKSINKYTLNYKYINNWYKNIWKYFLKKIA